MSKQQRYVGNIFPFGALDALTDVAVHQYGPQHLTRGGPTNRARAVVARGGSVQHAADVASRQGKGHVAEVQVAASYSLLSGLFGEGFHSQPNNSANHPHEDLHVLLGDLIANNAQIGIGKPEYVARKAMASNANQVVINAEARAVLEERGDPAFWLTDDHMSHASARSVSLTEEKAAGEARVILERLLMEEPAVRFAQRVGVSLTSGAKSSALAVARSLVYQAVHRLYHGLPFDGGMVRSAIRASGDAFLNASLTTYMLTTKFLARAGAVFDGRLLRVLGGSAVVAGAIADFVISTGKDIVAWAKNRITTDELLRRAGVHVFSAGGAAAGGALALNLARGMPGWLAMLMFAAGALGGGYCGHELGKLLFHPQGDLSPAV